MVADFFEKSVGIANAEEVFMNAKGFTGWDVLILLSTVVLLMGLVLLANRPSRGARGGRIQCVSNQKQIALAFRMWSNDHANQFPMSSGAKDSAVAGDPIPSFLILSNELVSPKLLLCPEDQKRGPRALIFAGLAAKNISYLVGIDANETNVASILTADRNVVLPDLKQPQGLLSITDSGSAQWSREIHKQQGNIALVDGSASQATQDGLRKALRGSGLATNRFAVP